MFNEEFEGLRGKKIKSVRVSRYRDTMTIAGITIETEDGFFLDLSHRHRCITASLHDPATPDRPDDE
jgi:hypothetical protein